MLAKSAGHCHTRRMQRYVPLSQRSPDEIRTQAELYRKMATTARTPEAKRGLENLAVRFAAPGRATRSRGEPGAALAACAGNDQRRGLRVRSGTIRSTGAGHSSLCHGRAWPGHPRFCCWQQREKTWVAGPSPAMTQGFAARLVAAVISHRPLSRRPGNRETREGQASAPALTGAGPCFPASSPDRPTQPALPQRKRLRYKCRGSASAGAEVDVARLHGRRPTANDYGCAAGHACVPRIRSWRRAGALRRPRQPFWCGVPPHRGGARRQSRLP